MSRIGGPDREVHDPAARPAGEARRGDMEAVPADDAGPRRGSVACRAELRERLRSVIP